MERKSKFAPELREQAVRRVRDSQADHESQWAAIQSVAEEFGCTAETLRQWLRRAEQGTSDRSPPIQTSSVRAQSTHRGNEILRRVLAQFDRAELQRLSK